MLLDFMRYDWFKPVFYRRLKSKCMCVCISVKTYKAVCVLRSIAATCTLTMATVTNVGTEATSVTLLSTHRLRYCGETDIEEKKINTSHN